MKPPFLYFGAKGTAADRIVALLPPHEHYVEPYCGSLAVLLAKPPSLMETVNDLDHELMLFWRVLRGQPEDLMRVCHLTPHSRAEYEASDRDEDLPPLEVARRVWVRLTQGRSGSLRGARNGWRHNVDPLGSNTSMPNRLTAYAGRMGPIVDRLHGVSLECLPALDLITKYGVGRDVLLYVDPPYLGDTRAPRSYYRHEMRTEAEHRELAEALHAANAAVVLSGYPSDLYDRDLYADWDRVTIAAATGNGVGDRSRTEVLWSNRPLGGDLPLFDLSEVAP